MKRSLIALVFVTACSHPATTTTTTTAPIGAPGAGTAPATSTPPRTIDQAPGAATPRLAVENFLNAVHAQDIQAMSGIFGTNRGPSRDNMNREELEKRLIILQCYFNHDKFRIVSESPGEGGHRIVATELTRGTNNRTPRFYVIPGPANRYYVDNMEIAAVRDFCRGEGR
ncbi:MAG: hypothetical protein ABI556_02155 [Gemmatimonadales bacterium]